MGPFKKQKSKKRSKRMYDDDETKNKYNRKRLPEDELLKLVNAGWSGPDMAEYFGCEKSKVYRQLKSMEVSTHGFKTPGVSVQRELRPNKPYIRGGITRREILTEDVIEGNNDDYVLAPRSLTHLGIFDKLSRWGFHVHMGIDVYTRYVVHMEVSVHNDAATVLSCFQKGVEEKGLPVAVRCDETYEIAGIVKFMDLNRPDVEDRMQYRKAGFPSRFRRVWCDVLRLCLQPYRALFQNMEAEGQLNIHDSVDIYCLHECYMHLIKNDLAEFTRKWNRHKISTAGVMNPIQLYMIGLFKIQRRAGLEGEYFKELEEPKIIEVDPDQEWPKPSTPCIHHRILKKKKDRAELRENFPQESITFETAPKTFRQMRRKVHQLLNKTS